jgi:hypothetical protein
MNSSMSCEAFACRRELRIDLNLSTIASPLCIAIHLQLVDGLVRLLPWLCDLYRRPPTERLA